MIATGRGAVIALALAIVTAPVLVVGARAQPHQDTGPVADSRGFEATMSASGRRETLAVEGGRIATTLRLSGALVVTRSDGLGKGFRAEFLGFDDGSGTGTARSVWTDDAGDKIFSRMVGSDMQAGRQTSATITGGTGRYAGIRGTYSFTWRYVMPDEHGVVHVRVVAMRGRYRVESPR